MPLFPVDAISVHCLILIGGNRFFPYHGSHFIPRDRGFRTSSAYTVLFELILLPRFLPVSPRPLHTLEQSIVLSTSIGTSRSSGPGCPPPGRELHRLPRVADRRTVQADISPLPFLALAPVRLRAWHAPCCFPLQWCGASTANLRLRSDIIPAPIQTAYPR